VNYQFSDEILDPLENQYYQHIDGIIDQFRAISLLSEKEFRLRYQKDQTIRIAIGESQLYFHFRIQAKTAYLNGLEEK